ncbi:hypothetical protein KM043_004790 [Ampulex compressa]|nr:hypothetical protein KM043_004790 [Ampulex compressa]
METFRSLIAIAAIKDWKFAVYDVKTAYLNAELEVPVYMEQPEGFVDKERSDNVCRLKKSIYRLPQSGYHWNKKFDETLKRIGLYRITEDACVYKWECNNKTAIIGGEEGNTKFVNIELRSTKEGIELSQKEYMKRISQEYGLEECNPVRSPMDSQQNLDEDKDSQTVDITKCQRILGSLMYLSVGMDTGSMKRILGGLAQAGAWGCFDEFNRLEEETLSAITMLIRPLQEAIRDGLPQLQLSDQNVKLDPHCCIFITMNPAGDDYGGRRKLPDSLARLFRPISMAHPDRLDIAKVLLECAGFLDAPTLAKQLLETLDMSETLLSRQPHYDWGLRALRSILGALPLATQLDESSKLLAAIKTSTLPKLTEEDTLKFLALLEDIFPKADLSLYISTENLSIQDTLLELCNANGFDKNMVNKCIQLYDQLRNWTGVAIVGPPGCGKSTVRKLLCDTLLKVGKKVTQKVIFPGAMPKSRLLGRVDSQTREWREGLLSSIVGLSGEAPTWIVFNGDVEPEWAEALNSALDDNRLLTLPSGIGVKLGTGIRFIFETHNLSGASPATVSRLGVVHLGSMNPSSLILSSRLDLLPSTIKETAIPYLCDCIEEIMKKNTDVFSTPSLMDAALCHLQKATTHISVTQALLASLCGQIRDTAFRDQVAHFIYQRTDCWCPDTQKPYDVLYDKAADRLELIANKDGSIETEDGPVALSGIMRRALAAVLPWVENNQPVMIRGPKECGKSNLASAILSTIRGNEPSTVIKSFSIYGIQDFVTRIKRSCICLDSTSHGRIYKPRYGSKIILVLEDVHLASKDLQVRNYKP